jgi:hypothetical protein
VGLSGNCHFDDPSLRAFIWEPGGSMVDLNALISPSLGIQLRNVATINDRGEMAAVAFFPDGSHGPVLLVPCDAHVPDCQDTQGLNTGSSSARPTATMSPAPGSEHRPKPFPNELQTVLARRRLASSQHTAAK